MRESEYFDWKRGTLSEERWNALAEAIRINLGAKWSRDWWESHGKQSKTAEFRDYVASLVKDQDFIDDYLSSVAKDT
jgi:hypothetical protein